MKTLSKSYEVLFESIGNRLYLIRHSRKEKIEAVAKSIGVSHTVISKIENGRYPGVSVALLAKLADYYQIPFEELIDNPQRKNSSGDKENQNTILIELLIAENKKLKQGNL